MTEVASLVSLLALLLPLPAQPRALTEDGPATLPTVITAGKDAPWPMSAWPGADTENELLLPAMEAPRPAEVQISVMQFTQPRAPEEESSDLMVPPELLLASASADSSGSAASPTPEEPTEKKNKIDLSGGLKQDNASHLFTMPSLVEMAAIEQPGSEFLDGDTVNEGLFFRGRTFLEANAGIYISQPGIGPRTPTFDFAPVNLRLGMVLNDPCLPGFLRGSFEGLVELSTAPVVSGFGDIVVGPTALLRYNWVQPHSRLVPYLQGGAGFVYNDAYENRYQRAIGEAMEFSLKAMAGCHYLVNDHVSLEIEAGFNHISNADLASRNLGINAVGGSIGITFYFPCGRR